MHTWPNFAFTVAYTGSGGALSLTPLAGAIAFTGYAPTVASSGSTLTLSVTESVSSGVAPFAVFFDATASTSTQTTRPIHDVFYAWDFGDTGAGTWSNGTGANTSRNAAYGPVASHMFETAGTYTVTLTAHDGVSVTSTTKTITVTAADTEWAGTKTVAYSTGAAPVPGVNGVPTGATCVGGVTDISASYAANKGTGNKRHLLQAGDTFAIASSLTIDVGGPSMIGKFGTGANPIINSTLTGTSVIGLSKSATPTGVSDWRFQDITIDCGNQNNSSAFASNGSYSKMLINRVYMTRCGYGLLMSGSTLNALNASVPYTHAMWDQVYMVDSTIYDLYTSASGPNAIFANGQRVAVMGCNINNNGNGEHGIRFQYCNRGVFSNNTIQGIPAGKTNLTIRGLAYLGDNTLTTPVYSEKLVVSDNKLVGGDSIGMVGFGPQNTTSDERGRHLIFERNWIIGSATTQNAMLVNHPDVTIRNNLASIPGPTGGYLFCIQPSGVVPVPDRVNVYNNTCYYGGNTSNTWDMVQVSANNETSPFDQTMPGSVFEVKNNILYAPNRIANVSVFRNANGSVATTNQSNNTSNVVTDPLFAATPPTAIAHFTPSSGSYAQGAGAAIPVWSDFYNTTTQATPDIGAVVI